MSKKKDGDDGAEVKPEFVAYDPHPYLADYPKASPEDLGAVQASVAQEGVRQPIVLWKGPGKRIFLIDGRTRQEAAANEFARAVEENRPPEAANGVSLQPDIHWFDGTMDEVYSYIKVANTRKNYTQGQKLAIGVRQYYHEFKKRNGDTLPPIEKEIDMPGGLTADELARRGGFNVSYARIGKQLYRDRPDLLDAVGMNATTPKEAKSTMEAEAAAKESALAGTGVDETAGKTAPEPPGAAEVVRDGNSDPVPPSLEDAFRTRAAAKVVLKKLSDVESSLTGVVDSVGGTHMGGPALLKLLRAVKKGIQQGVPHIPCKSCKGRGRNFGRDCVRCNVTGFVSKGILAAEAKAEKAAGDAAAEPDGDKEKAAE